MHALLPYYLSIRELHVIAVALSLVFFIIRAYWSISGSKALTWRFVRITPHIVDTVLLVCGLLLAFMIGPFQPWILTKIVLLIAYIGVGTIAIKRGRTPRARAVAAVIAILIFLYIVGVAIRHNPASWFAM